MQKKGEGSPGSKEQPAKQERSRDFIRLANVSPERFPALRIVPMTVEHISLLYVCQSLNLFNNPMRLAVFLFSSHIRGNRGTKRLGKLPEVTQPLRTGHLTPESLFPTMHGMQPVQEIGSQCGWGMRGWEEVLERKQRPSQGSSEGPIRNLDFILITLGSP